ncbi:MAG: M64 family metallopeptidase, partial [Fibrobacterales bacterium]
MKALLTLFATATFIFAEPTVTRIGEGPVDNRIQIVIIGDGYTAQDIQDLYIPTVESTLEYMLEHPIKNRPYPRYKKFLNFYRIDIESEDSGVDLIHGKQDHEKVYRNTALGGEDGCTDYAIAKVCGADWDLVHETIDALAAKENFLPNWYLVMLNDTRYNAAAHHAGGRKLPIYSAHYEGNWDMRDVALHEAAHAWHNLADEYGGSGNYTGGEPSEVNVT